jgi:hypothetical protein
MDPDTYLRMKCMEMAVHANPRSSKIAQVAAAKAYYQTITSGSNWGLQDAERQGRGSYR